MAANREGNRCSSAKKRPVVRNLTLGAKKTTPRKSWGKTGTRRTTEAKRGKVGKRRLKGGQGLAWKKGAVTEVHEIEGAAVSMLHQPEGAAQ